VLKNPGNQSIIFAQVCDPTKILDFRRRAFEEQRKVLLEAQRLEDEHRQREEKKYKET